MLSYCLWLSVVCFSIEALSLALAAVDNNTESENGNFAMPEQRFGGSGDTKIFSGLHNVKNVHNHKDLLQTPSKDDEEFGENDLSNLPTNFDKDKIIKEDNVVGNYHMDRQDKANKMNDSPKIPPCYKRNIHKDDKVQSDKNLYKKQKHDTRRKINTSPPENRRRLKPCFKRKMNKAAILKIINAIERMLNHFALYTHGIIVDGMLGLRSTEMILRILSKKLSSPSNRQGNRYTKRVKKLYEIVKKVSNKGFQYIQQSRMKYNIKYEKLSRPLPKSFLHAPTTLKGLTHFYEKGIYLFSLISILFLFFTLRH